MDAFFVKNETENNPVSNTRFSVLGSFLGLSVRNACGTPPGFLNGVKLIVLINPAQEVLLLMTKIGFCGGNFFKPNKGPKTQGARNWPA